MKEDREKWVVCEKKELAVVENELYMKVNKNRGKIVVNRYCAGIYARLSVKGCEKRHSR